MAYSQIPKKNFKTMPKHLKTKIFKNKKSCKDDCNEKFRKLKNIKNAIFKKGSI